VAVSATELIEKMRPMPTEEKRAVVEQIWEEFGDELAWSDPDLTAEQAAELDRRVEAVERDPSRGIPLERIQAEIKQRFGGRPG
jgi:putative addiction module component (TIGR02574 family)